jgi:hypothetical protein
VRGPTDEMRVWCTVHEAWEEVVAWATTTPGLVVHLGSHFETNPDRTYAWFVTHAMSGMAVARGLSHEHAQFIASHLGLADINWTHERRAIEQNPHAADITFILDQMGAHP